MSKQQRKIQLKKVQEVEAKDDSRSFQEWLVEKTALMKRLSELEKEVKTLKRSNNELQSQLNQQLQQQDDRKGPSCIKSSRNETSKHTLAINLNSLEKFSINSRKAHKRVTSELLTMNFKKKLKQNSDDITRSEAFKRIIKQKPNSFGGCPGKILENKILSGIIKEFRRDMIKSHEQNIQNSNTTYKSTISTSTNPLVANGNISIGVSSKQKMPLFNQIDYLAYHTENPINKPSLGSLYSMFQPKVIPESKVTLTQASTNNNNHHPYYNHLSEREDESSSATQETILQKPNNFSNTNSFSNRNNESVSNNTHTENGINITNSLMNDSINFDSSMRFQPSNTSQSKDNSSSRSSIIFQPQKDSKLSNQSSNNNSRYLHNPIAVLKYHLDSVRGVYINPSQKTLVSIGDDSLVCFWDLEKALKHYKENLKPYAVLRSHTTSVITLTGPKVRSRPFEAVYTSGVDGVIRASKIPDSQAVKGGEDLTDESTLLPWRGHQDMIWQLDYHPKTSVMSSVSSDGTVKIFKCYEEDSSDKRYYSYDSGSKNLLRSFMFRNHCFNFIEIPTSSTWSLHNDHQLYVSHIASYIKKYDIETGQSIGDISYFVEKNIPFESQQANRILYHQSSLICTGHEDHQIRFFDVNGNKQVKSFVAHADAISSLSNGMNEHELLSASHDGTIRCWDLRINKLIFDIPAHRKKYDEGCLSLNVIPSENLMITSGSDGIIKLFQL